MHARINICTKNVKCMGLKLRSLTSVYVKTQCKELAQVLHTTYNKETYKFRRVRKILFIRRKCMKYFTRIHWAVFNIQPAFIETVWRWIEYQLEPFSRLNWTSTCLTSSAAYNRRIPLVQVLFNREEVPNCMGRTPTGCSGLPCTASRLLIYAFIHTIRTTSMAGQLLNSFNVFAFRKRSEPEEI